MLFSCPKCQRGFPSDQVNVARDVGFCPACQEGFALSELAHRATAVEPELDFTQLPPGITYEPQPDGAILTASTRSWLPVFLIPFMAVWSGFSLGGIYGHQIYSGQFSWLLSLFGLPFVLGTVILLHEVLMRLWGEVRLTRRGDEVEVFTGYFNRGHRQSIRLSEVEFVREETDTSGESTTTTIVVGGKQQVALGSELSAKRRQFVLGALRQWRRQR